MYDVPWMVRSAFFVNPWPCSMLHHTSFHALMHPNGKTHRCYTLTTLHQHTFVPVPCHHSRTHVYHTITSSSSQFIKRVRLSVLRNARHTVMIKISAVKVIFSKHSFGKGMQRRVRGVGRQRGNVPGSRCKGGWGWNVVAKRKGNTTVHPCFAIGVGRSVPPSIVFVSGFRCIPSNVFSPPMHGHSSLFVPTMNVGIEITRVGVSGFPARFRFTEFLQRRFSRGHGENRSKIGCSNGIDGKDVKQQAWEGVRGH